jgi:hypothetical protein
VRTPIHYVFPTAEAAAEGRRRTYSDGSTGVAGVDESILADDAADMPFLEVDEDEFFSAAGGGGGGRRRERAGEDYGDDADDEDERYGASPRRDAVTTFMSTRRGAVKVRVGSVAIGAAMGGFIGKVRIYLFSTSSPRARSSCCLILPHLWESNESTPAPVAHERSAHDVNSHVVPHFRRRLPP